MLRLLLSCLLFILSTSAVAVHPWETRPPQDGLRQEALDAQASYQRWLAQKDREQAQQELQLNTIVQNIKHANNFRRENKNYYADNRTDPQSLTVFDESAVLWMQNNFSGSQVPAVFLAAGNPYEHPNEIQTLRLVSLLKSLRKAKIFIVYDADSLCAEIIEQTIPPDVRLGLSSSKNGDYYLRINNPFLRMEAIHFFHRTIILPDSLLGVGLMLTASESKGHTQYFFDYTDNLKKGLSSWTAYLTQDRQLFRPQAFGSEDFLRQKQSFWQKDVLKKRKNKPWKLVNKLGSIFGQGEEDFKLERVSKPATPAAIIDDYAQAWAGAGAEVEATVIDVPAEEKILLDNLGINYSKQNNTSFSDEKVLVEKISSTFKDDKIANLVFNFNEVIDGFNSETLKKINDSSNSYAQNLLKVEDMSRCGPHDCGAVLFGSSTGSALYLSAVASCVQRIAELGYALSTGGAGGFMYLTNKIAADFNVPSIGMPMDRSNELSTEIADIGSKKITMIPVRGYAQRIPFLLHKKFMVLIAPGGDGTMKELATLLINSAGKPAYLPNIVFIYADYYRPLIDWMRSLNLPSEFLNKIFLVNSSAELPIS